MSARAQTNGSHGPPLDSSSCGPPNESSGFLTLNAPDRTAPYNTPAAGTGSVKMRVFCTDGAVPPCVDAPDDQQDVAIELQAADTRCVAATGGCATAGGPYSGKILATITARVTDRLNGPEQNATGTLTDYPLAFGAQCAAGACNLSSSFDAVIPGIAREQKRAVWQLGQIEVLDGGSDGELAAAPFPASGVCPPACAGNGDETVFLRQGLFIP